MEKEEFNFDPYVNEDGSRRTDLPEVNLTIKSETIEAKVHKVKPMAWWYMYKWFPECYHHNRWYFRLLVKIEKVVRFIIRKPVVVAKPTFEVEPVMKSVYGEDINEVLKDIMLKDYNAPSVEERAEVDKKYKIGGIND